MLNNQIWAEFCQISAKKKSTYWLGWMSCSPDGQYSILTVKAVSFLIIKFELNFCLISARTRAFCLFGRAEIRVCQMGNVLVKSSAKKDWNVIFNNQILIFVWFQPRLNFRFPRWAIFWLNKYQKKPKFFLI